VHLNNLNAPVLNVLRDETACPGSTLETPINVCCEVMANLRWKLHECTACNEQHFGGAFAKLWKTTISFVMSVRPHGTTQLILDGFSWNLVFGYFSENMSRKFKFH